MTLRVAALTSGLRTPSSRFYLPRWALPHIPNHDDPTDQILFFDPTNKAPPATEKIAPGKNATVATAKRTI